MRRVVAVANPKGGAGRTSLTANIAARLAEMGQRTLTADLNRPGDLAIDLRYMRSDDDGKEFVQRPNRIVYDVRPGLDILVGERSLVSPAERDRPIGPDTGHTLTRQLVP